VGVGGGALEVGVQGGGGVGVVDGLHGVPVGEQRVFCGGGMVALFVMVRRVGVVFGGLLVALGRGLSPDPPRRLV